VVAPSGPSSPIWRSKQCVDFRSAQEWHQCPREALGWNSQDALDLRCAGGILEGHIAKEGVDGCQAKVSRSWCNVANLLEVIEESRYQRGIDVFQHQRRGCAVQMPLRELQEQPKGVAVRSDRVRAHLALLHEPLCKEALQ
jgi:hypothetical protein